MSRIDDLIAELCPEGVEFVELGKLLAYEQPTKYLVDSTAYSDSYATPVLTAGQTFVLGRTDETNGIYPASTATPVIIFDDFTTAFKWVDFPFKAKSSAMKMLTPKEAGRASLRYIYYVMQTIRYEPQDHARQWIGIYSGFQVPVPPLEVQREIVRVLDQFTQLEAELEAELEARRRQYEHYRQLAMSFDDSIPRVALGDIAEVRSGWGFPNAHQGREEGEYPFYKVGDMNLPGNETVMSIANNYVSAEVAKNLGVRPAPAGTVIFPKIGAAVATNKKRVLSVPSAYDNNVMGLVPTERVTSRFLYHWMQTFDLSRLANDSGAVPSIRKTEAEKVLIPLPDLDTQREVAGLLDKFDALVNDLSVGLPAELAARRKQYEYYRDKLLTFKELAA